MQRQEWLLGSLIALLLAPGANAGDFLGALWDDDYTSPPKFAEAPSDDDSSSAEDVELPFDLQVEVDKTQGVNAQLTLPFGPRVEAQLHVEYLGRWDVGRMGTRTLACDGWGATTNLKARLAGYRLRPYVLAGIGLYEDRAREPGEIGLSKRKPDIGVRLGAGFDLYATDEVTVSFVASYLVSAGQLDSIDSVAVGMGALVRF
jgi:hypothetical protein